jgi:hypothetical protein
MSTNKPWYEQELDLIDGWDESSYQGKSVSRAKELLGHYAWAEREFGDDVAGQLNDAGVEIARLMNSVRNATEASGNAERELFLKWGSKDNQKDFSANCPTVDEIVLSPDKVISSKGAPDVIDALGGQALMAATLKRTMSQQAFEHALMDRSDDAKLHREIWQAAETAAARKQFLREWPGHAGYLARHAKMVGADKEQAQAFIDSKPDKLTAAVFATAWSMAYPTQKLKLPESMEKAVTKVCQTLDLATSESRYVRSKAALNYLRRYFEKEEEQPPNDGGGENQEGGGDQGDNKDQGGEGDDQREGGGESGDNEKDDQEGGDNGGDDNSESEEKDEKGGGEGDDGKDGDDKKESDGKDGKDKEEKGKDKEQGKDKDGGGKGKDKEQKNEKDQKDKDKGEGGKDKGGGKGKPGVQKEKPNVTDKSLFGGGVGSNFSDSELPQPMKLSEDTTKLEHCEAPPGCPKLRDGRYEVIDDKPLIIPHLDNRPEYEWAQCRDPRGSYRNIVKEVRVLTESIVRSIGFRRDSPAFPLHGLMSGDLDEGSLDKIASRESHPAVFERTEVCAMPSVAIALLVDLSGSMSSVGRTGGTPRYVSAQQVCTAMFEAFKRLKGLNLLVCGHNTSGAGEYRVYEFYGKQARSESAIAKMRPGASNADGYAMEMTIKKLAEYYPTAKQKYVFVLADGQPAATNRQGEHYGGPPAYQHMSKVVKWGIHRYGIQTYGIGIDGSPSQSAGDEMYGEGRYICLPDVIGSARIISTFLARVTAKA